MYTPAGALLLCWAARTRLLPHASVDHPPY